MLHVTDSNEPRGKLKLAARHRFQTRKRTSWRLCGAQQVHHERAAGPPPPPQPRLLGRSSRAAGRIVTPKVRTRSRRFEPSPTRHAAKCGKSATAAGGSFRPSPGSSVPRRRPARAVGRLAPAHSTTRAPPKTHAACAPSTRHPESPHMPTPRAPPPTRDRTREIIGTVAPATAAAARHTSPHKASDGDVRPDNDNGAHAVKDNDMVVMKPDKIGDADFANYFCTSRLPLPPEGHAGRSAAHDGVPRRRARRPGAPKTVLDVGTGSGIPPSGRAVRSGRVR